MLAANGLAADIHLGKARASAATTASPPAASPGCSRCLTPHADLLRGHDGGLNKTGTMEGVRTLAGYADTSSHGQVRFVISLAGDDSRMRFRLLHTIQSGL